jgi:tetratricopeptide (TPR) repeat protein
MNIQGKLSANISMVPRKSQIALEYCFRKRHKQPSNAVFWVNAATVARFEESFQRMAKEFGLGDCEDAQQDSLMSVKNWLETEIVDPWVMIIDNVDDETAFFRDKCHNDKAPSQLLPRCSHGQLFFTSRTRDVAFDLASPATPISVDLLTTEEGLDLLRKRLGPDPPEASLIELLSELGHIPLAITQAISFIMKRRQSVEQYLELYRRDENSRSRLLSHEFLDHGRQEQTMESVARTWQISFEWIQKSHPKAAEILCFMGFYQHHGVPERLLRSDDVDAFEFEESIAVLQAFSLLDVNKAGNSYSTHRLIQVTTKLWLEQNGPAQLEKWALRVLDQVAMWFPALPDTWDDKYLESCQSLLPHADLLLEQSFNISKKESDLAKAELLLRTGRYIDRVGDNLGDVQRRYKRSLEIRQSYLGSEHPDTWLSMRFYFASLTHSAAVYPPEIGSQGVADMGHALLNHYREVFGSHQPYTIQALSHLARFLAKQGDLQDSEAMQREAVRLSKEVNGSTSIDTVTYMGSLAHVLTLMKRFDEALQVSMESMRIRTKIHGPEHRTVLIAKSNLAVYLANVGRCDEAITLGKEVLMLNEKVLGGDHPQTLKKARNLAGFLRHQGRYEEALDVLGYVLSTIQVSRKVFTGDPTVQKITELKLKIEHDLAASQLENIHIGSNTSERSPATEE